MRWGILIACLATMSLATVSLAKAQVNAAKQAARVAEIWSFAEQRASRQTDTWFRGGDYPRSIQLLRLRAELNPSDYEINGDLGWMLSNVRAFDEALAVYVRFRQRNPQNPDAPYLEANFYFQRKAYAKVPPLLEPTLPRNPHPNSYRLLAHSYERLGLLADSQRTWRRYLDRVPSDEAAKNNLRRVEGKIRGAA